MQVDVRSDIDRLTKRLSDIQRRHIPFAAAAALTDSAKAAQADVRTQMQRVFDAPTKFTLNSLFIKPATKQKLEAEVFFKDQSEAGKGVPAGKYLQAELEGGPRRHKRFERALIAAGVMPTGYYAVPSTALSLDANGNVPRSLQVKLLSDLRAFPDVGTRSNRLTRAEVDERNKTRGKGRKAKFRASRYFVRKPNTLTGTAPPGIYHKTAEGGAQPVFIFVRTPTYGRALKFPEIVTASVRDTFPKALETRLAQALATAR